jgi:hypothetical protein
MPRLVWRKLESARISKTLAAFRGLLLYLRARIMIREATGYNFSFTKTQADIPEVMAFTSLQRMHRLIHHRVDYWGREGAMSTTPKLLNF